MDLAVPPELEDLLLCSCCRLPFNDADAIPKVLQCRHYFCLKCVNTILLKSGELYCFHCWKRTELSANDMRPDNLPTHSAILYLVQNHSTIGNFKVKPPPDKQMQQMHQSTTSVTSNNIQKQHNDNMKKGENCHTHAMPNALWCSKCHTLICRACAGSEEHRNHTVRTQSEAKDCIRSDIASELLSMQKTLHDVQHLVLKQRDFLLKILESCTMLKTQIETDLINHIPTLEISEMRESIARSKIYIGMIDQHTPLEAYKLYSTLHLEKQRLQSKYQDMYLQCKLDDLIRNYGSLFDFDLIKQALNGIHNGNGNDKQLSIYSNGHGHNNPVLLLANYCVSQLYSRHLLANKTIGGTQSLIGNNTLLTVQQSGSVTPNMIVGQQQQAASPNITVTLNNGTTQSHNTMMNQHQGGSTTNVASPHHDGLLTSKTFAEIAAAHKSPNPNNHVTSILSNSISDTTSTLNTILSGPPQNQTSSLIGPIRPPTHFEMNGLPIPSSMIHQMQHTGGQQLASSPQPPTAPILCNPSIHIYPIYFFNIETNGTPCGRILIEVRSDVAPKMAKNFGALSTGELGFGYKGCQIFQCWENESIITGDFELNNGRGGRSVFEESFFMPDDTKILAIRGSVGMRRSQKRHDNMGLVGSQFRIILREMRGFTGIFAFVVEGLELVEKISQAGDSAGKPQNNIVIVNCGKFQ